MEYYIWHKVNQEEVKLGNLIFESKEELVGLMKKMSNGVQSMYEDENFEIRSRNL